jgi:putative transposase
MPFWRLCYHLVWATGNREPLLTPEIEARLYPFLVAKAGEVGAYVYAIGGACDHIHVIAAIPPHRSVADVVKRLKGSSSHYLNQTGSIEGGFAWQHGYGALSLGQRQRPLAQEYVARQKEHHAAKVANPWLERCAELDEGPDEQRLQVASSLPFVRDSEVTYTAENDCPF